MSEDVERISITLEPDLLSDLNNIVDEDNYTSRSEATRDALRAFVTEYHKQTNLQGELSGTIVVLYEHENHDVIETINELQHEYADTIIAVHHVHLTNDMCLESIAIEGKGKTIEELISDIRPLNGVYQTKLTVIN